MKRREERSLISSDRDAGDPDVRRGGMVDADGVPFDLASERTRHRRACSKTTFTGDGVATLKPVIVCGKVLRAGAIVDGSADDGPRRLQVASRVFLLAQSSPEFTFPCRCCRRGAVACWWVT